MSDIKIVMGLGKRKQGVIIHEPFHIEVQKQNTHIKSPPVSQLN